MRVEIQPDRLLSNVNVDNFTNLLRSLYSKTLTPTSKRGTKNRKFKEHDGLIISTGKDGLYVNDFSGNSGIACGNPITIIMSAKGFNYVEACHFLAKELNLSKSEYTAKIKPTKNTSTPSTKNTSTPSTKNTSTPSTKQTFVLKTWDKGTKEIDYLCNKIGADNLEPSWLEKHGIYPLQERTNLEGYTIKYTANNIGILFTDNPTDPTNGHSKAKQPNHKNEAFKSIALSATKQYIFNYRNLPATGDTLIVCEGESDCLAMLHHFGKDKTIDFINFNSVNTIPINIFEELKRRFENIYILFDNDGNDVGQNFAKKLSAEHYVYYIDISQHTKENDVCKIIVKEGVEVLEKILVFELAEERKAPPMEQEQSEPDFLELLRNSEKHLTELSTQDIVFPPPIISFRGHGVIYKNTINVVQGAKGSHKSRLAENLAALLLNRSKDLESNFCGFNRPITDKETYNVLYVDTERNIKNQYPSALQKLKFLAGFKKNETCQSLHAVSLIQIPRQERFTILSQFISEKVERLQGHLVVILDILTDCLGDFNSVHDTLELMDMINATIQNNDVTFLGIIHENPNSNKARGHLGTEIGNKVSSQLSINFVKNENDEQSDLIEVKFLKTRMGKKPDNLLLKYCEVKNTLVEADADEIEGLKEIENIACTVENVKQYIREKQNLLYFGNLIEANTLYTEIQQHFNVSTNTVKRRLQEIFTNGIEIQEQQFRLKKVTNKGKKTFLKLVKSKRKKHVSKTQPKTQPNPTQPTPTQPKKEGEPTQPNPNKQMTINNKS